MVIMAKPSGFRPMADVFVSYAKTDRPLASKLVAMLEAEGWKVWWDTSLAIGDDFRDEIMTELGRARAVIVIWTDASIKSDWVRSEAGRAQADRKLIPVKLEHLTYKDLPPPLSWPTLFSVIVSAGCFAFLFPVLRAGVRTNTKR